MKAIAASLRQAWQRSERVLWVVLLGAAVATLETGCGPSSRQRQAWMLANESAGATLDGAEGPSPAQAAAPGTVSTDAPGKTAPGDENAVDLATYRLSPGDLIDIKFSFHPEENQRVPIGDDGILNLPVTGDLPAAGRSVPELEEMIVERSSASLREPEVSIVIVQLAEQKVFVTGQVAKPGFVAFRPGMTPLQVVFEQGGFLDDAQADQVIHLRRVGGVVERTRLNLENTIDGQSPEAIALAPNDVLIVPRSFIGNAGLFVDQWIRGLLPSIPQPGYDLPLLFF